MSGDVLVDTPEGRLACEVNRDMYVAELLAHVLARMGRGLAVTGRDGTHYDLVTDAGDTLDPEDTLGSVGFDTCETLMLAVEPGAGGI